MVSAQFMIQSALTYTQAFLSDIKLFALWKALAATFVAIAAYLIGFDDLSIFLALIVLVAIEFVVMVISAVYTAPIGKRIKSFLEGIEIYAFGTSIQVVTYGLLTSAAHLTDTIVVNDNTFLESMVISFLAMSQMVRIVKSTGKMGFSLPASFVTWLEEYKTGPLKPPSQ